MLTFNLTYPIAFGCRRGAVEFHITFLHPSLLIVALIAFTISEIKYNTILLKK